MVLAAASVAQAAYNPIPILTSSYNADGIVESTATPVLKCVTTASVDQGTNNGNSTWYEIGYDAANPGFGLPLAGCGKCDVHGGAYPAPLGTSWSSTGI